jgi:ketosteroid isomerase-like protein
MASARTSNETVIREIFDKWAAAVRAEDINGIRANHSPEMLMFDVPPPFFSRGLDAIWIPGIYSTNAR